MIGTLSPVVENDTFDSIHFESITSINLSDITSQSSNNSVNSSNSSFNYTDSFTINQYAKRKVLKVLKLLRSNKEVHPKCSESKLVMVLYLEMIRDDHYRHVSFNMLEEFMIQSKMTPQAYYLHYYIYFLYYAAFYHNTRANIDIIDSEKKDEHKKHYICIIAQLKYIQYIINKSKTRNIQS